MDTAVLLVGFSLPLTPVGTWVVLGVADIVRILAILQYLGLPA